MSDLDPYVFTALPFDPMSLIEEARESLILKQLDIENSTNIREFLLEAEEETLNLVTNLCMNDPRLWEIYWSVIYEAAVDAIKISNLKK
jgi:hypothetical protein